MVVLFGEKDNFTFFPKYVVGWKERGGGVNKSSLKYPIES